MSTDLVYPHTVTEIKLATFSPSQQWYFLEKQMMDEVWLLKIVDSKAEEHPQVAKCASVRETLFGKSEAYREFLGTPHTSFHLPEASKSVQARESVEFRAYVFG